MGQMTENRNLTGSRGFANFTSMANRSASQGHREKTTVVERETRDLDPVEENVARMRNGLAGSDDLVLTQKGAGNADVMAKLRAIELRAFEESGRLDELRQEVGLAPTNIERDRKQKIVGGLRAKSRPADK